ncbi:uncharacterized protein LOC144356070 [Saccoglossus kowalevskii]
MELSWEDVLAMCGHEYGARMVDVEFLYHATSQTNKELICKDGFLKQHVVEDKFYGPSAPVVGLKGVFFCATLYNGVLPIRSPYGTERILIPLNAIFDDKCRFFFGSCKRYNNNKIYIYIVVARHGDWRLMEIDGLKEIDINYNPIFMKHGYNNFCLFHHANNNVWTEFLILGDVNADGMPWDDVEKFPS